MFQQVSTKDLICITEFVQNLYWVNNASLWESPGIGNWQSENEADLILVGNTTMETILAEEELMNEEITDKCTADIFQKCNATDECAKSFTVIGSKYSLTHQVFYFLFAKMVYIELTEFLSKSKLSFFILRKIASMTKIPHKRWIINLQTNLCI